MIRLASRHGFWVVAAGLIFAAEMQQGLADSAEDWQQMKGIVPKGYVCYRAAQPPTIDGNLADAAWQAAPWTEDFVDIEGERRPKPRFRTRAKMLWDSEYFYIAAELVEPHVWGTLRKRDSVVFQDNDFEVFIDPDGDNHEYYELEINALNTCWDLFLPRPYKDGGRADTEWNIDGLLTAVSVRGTLNQPSDQDEGWTIEVAMPWQVLREFAHRPAPPHDGDQWRINFSRVEWPHEITAGNYQKAANAREDNWVWSPQGIVDMHRPERWGYVQFSTAPAGTASFTPDRTLGGREALLEIYHLQKAFQAKHGRWAASVDELGLDPTIAADLPGPPRLTMTPAGFRAVVEIPFAESGTQVWSIRHDSRLEQPSPKDELRDIVDDVLSRQTAAWNDGDIDAFMEHYWKSDNLTFSSGGKTTHGWEATKENYKRRYPTRERMGNLSVAIIEVTPLGDSAALVLGCWCLEREPSPIGGRFSLIFRHIGGSWVIIHDHSSQRTPAAQPRQAADSDQSSSTHESASAKSASATGNQASRAAVEALEEYLAEAQHSRRPLLGEQEFAAVELAREDAARAQKLLWLDHVAHIRGTRAAEMAARELADGDLRMPFHLEIFGDKPPTGRSLYISMHGGGNAPKRVNDQQWENQKKLYRPKEGVYVAPRAPTDTWDLWHQAHIDRLFGRLIENLIVFEDVNPDRVYLLGYSAGGDGVYQLAPRMADRWAAAAMMAGHPNESSPLGLRNLPFAIHVGGLDNAYNRNRVAGDWGRRLDELQQADPDGYVHLVKVYEGKGHWLDRQDASAIEWMASYTRNPVPSRVVWKQDDVAHSRFYWLAVPGDSTKDRAEVVADRMGQQIEVLASGVERLVILVNDSMLDLDQPVTVASRGQPLFIGRIPRTIADLATSLYAYGDPHSVFSGRITVGLPKEPDDE
ncbi:MAG TPA: sugar-binding protein [Pirellulales bacterium]|nr:sugar-binding protein [Pirellulales bacterium]